MNNPRFQTIDADRFTAGQLAWFDGERFVPFVPLTVTGNETVVGLSVGQTTEITIDHSDQVDFATCEYPRCQAPIGVRVQVLAVGTDGDDTNGARFVLLLENISFNSYGGDVVIAWSRRGHL